MARARIAIVALAFALGASRASAQKLTLDVTPSTVTFASADPDTTPAIVSAPITVSVRVQQSNGVPWQLTVQAGGDLTSGAEAIDASQVAWTASPAPPFQDGTLSKSVAQRMASGTGNLNPATTGSVVFRLANSWNYSAGFYSQTLVFTLSAP
jgi:hypothetical protein